MEAWSSASELYVSFTEVIYYYSTRGYIGATNIPMRQTGAGGRASASDATDRRNRGEGAVYRAKHYKHITCGTIIGGASTHMADGTIL